MCKPECGGVNHCTITVPLNFAIGESLKDAQCKLFLSQVKERPDVGVYIKDLSAYVVNNADDMDRIMTLGHKNRTQPCCGQVYSSDRTKVWL